MILLSRLFDIELRWTIFLSQSFFCTVYFLLLWYLLKDIKTNGMSIVEVSDCRNGVPDKSMWHCADNAEQLVIDKYGSDSDKLITLREYRKNMA